MTQAIPSLKIGFIGFGEVGITLSRGLRERDPQLTIIAFDLFWSEERKAIANGLQIPIAPSLENLIARSNLVISAVIAQAACDVATSASPFLGEQHLFADLTSVGPGKVGKIDRAASAHGALFAKLALMGAVAAFGLQVPCAASGKGASTLANMLVPLGMKIEVLNDDPAAAATLKLCRSLFQKGIVSLALEALRVARKNGVEQQVIASLAETWNAEGFETALNRLICSSAVHAKRRGAELNEAIDAFGEMGISLPVAKAGREAFQELVDLQTSGRLQGQTPKEFIQVIDALDR